MSRNLRRLSGAVLAAAGVLAAIAGAVGAQQLTGLDKIHAQARVGGKVCMIEHEHYGESRQYPSRATAEGQAVRQWVIFTAEEYGKAWGSYDLAVGKRMSCESSGGLWVCKTSARPCRRG
jgi:hypothetical protein